MHKFKDLIRILIVLSSMDLFSIGAFAAASQFKKDERTGLASPLGFEVLTFSQWKQRRVNEARQNLLQIQQVQLRDGGGIKVEVVSNLPGQQGRAKPSQTGKIPLEQAGISLEVAESLTMSDYVSIYLSQLPASREVFAEISRRMNSDEVADLLQMVRPPGGPEARAQVYDNTHGLRIDRPKSGIN